jgi:hypothetical protein
LKVGDVGDVGDVGEWKYLVDILMDIYYHGIV